MKTLTLRCYFGKESSGVEISFGLFLGQDLYNRVTKPQNRMIKMSLFRFVAATKGRLWTVKRILLVNWFLTLDSTFTSIVCNGFHLWLDYQYWILLVNLTSKSTLAFRQLAHCGHTRQQEEETFSTLLKKLQHNPNIPQGSHLLFTCSITVVQINKIDLTLTSNLTLTLTQNVHAKSVKNNQETSLWVCWGTSYCLNQGILFWCGTRVFI